VLFRSMRVKAEYDANLVVDRMVDAGVFTATLDATGTSVFFMGKYTIKGIGKAWDHFIGGNKEGAYRALKDLMNLDDNQVDEIIRAWEKSTGEKAKGMTRASKALKTIPLTETGAEGIVSSALGLSPKASAAVARTLDARAKDLNKSTSHLTNENIGAVIKDDLATYMETAKNFYTGIRKHGADSMEESGYKFDYNKLAIQPLLDSTKDKITNPALAERFLKYMQKIEKIGKPKSVLDKTSELILPESVKRDVVKKEATSKLRSFDDLIDLRQTINEFKSNTKLKSVVGRRQINKVLKNIDDEIARAANKHMDNPKVWLKEWGRANIEYSKMKFLEHNVLYKALTAKVVAV